MNVSDEIEEELEAIHAIIIEGIEVHRKPDVIEVQVQISPLTALDAEQSFVGFLLVLLIEKHYPAYSPSIKIRNPRGMSDEQFEEVNHLMQLKCEEFRGSPVIFELLDLGREYLTRSNIPKSAPCSICLYSFENKDVFCKTKCFHHFHSSCLGRYLKCLQDEFRQKLLKESTGQPNCFSNDDKCEMLCPICRLDISEMDVDNLISAPEPILSKDDTFNVITPELRTMQRQMDKLFIKQLNSGGIIDKEAEEKRYLIVTSSTSEDSAASSSSSVSCNTKESEPPSNKKDFKNKDKRERRSFYTKQEFGSKFSKHYTKTEAGRLGNKTRNGTYLSTIHAENSSIDPVNVNNSVNVIDESSSDRKKTNTKSGVYRGGRGKGRRYQPRPS